LEQRRVEKERTFLLDMIVTHGQVDLGELVASLPLNALVERRKLAMLRWLCRRNRRPAKPVAMICTATYLDFILRSNCPQVGLKENQRINPMQSKLPRQRVSHRRLRCMLAQPCIRHLARPVTAACLQG